MVHNWNVCKKHDRSAGRATLKIILEPLRLFVTERSHTSNFQIGDVYKADEMHTFVIEAVPAAPPCTLPIALEILLAVVGQHVVLAGHEVGLFRGRSL